MVAPAPKATLPELSPEDQALLLHYLRSNELLPEHDAPPADPTHATSTLPASPISASSPLLTLPFPSLLSLYSWLSRPDIAAWVAFHRLRQHQLRKQQALDHLEAVAASTEDPIEKRRAATTILRALALPVPANASPAEAPDRPSKRRRPAAIKSSTAHDDVDSEPDDEDDADPPIPTIAEFFANKPGLIQTPEGAPLPSPDLTPEQVCSIVIESLKTADAAALTTLFNFSQTNRYSDRDPAELESRNKWYASYRAPCFGFTDPHPGPLISIARDTLVCPVTAMRPEGPIQFHIALNRQNWGTFHNCWLFHSVNLDQSRGDSS